MNKAELQKKIDELQDKLDKMPDDEYKVGDWCFYKSIAFPNGAVFRIYKIDGKRYWDDWYYDIGRDKIETRKGYFEYTKALSSELRKATYEEVKEALVKEVDRRYGIDCRLKSADGKHNQKIQMGGTYNYDANKDALYISGFFCLYMDGDWAEIVEDTIEINGYEAEVFSKTVDVGCKKDILHEVFQAMNGYINHFDLQVWREGENITEQIKQIAERINEA